MICDVITTVNLIYYDIIIKTGLFFKIFNGKTSQIKNSKNYIVIIHSISNESCKPLNCNMKQNLNVMVCSVER